MAVHEGEVGFEAVEGGLLVVLELVGGGAGGLLESGELLLKRLDTLRANEQLLLLLLQPRRQRMRLCIPLIKFPPHLYQLLLQELGLLLLHLQLMLNLTEIRVLANDRSL